MKEEPGLGFLGVRGLRGAPGATTEQREDAVSAELREWAPGSGAE